MKKAGKLIIVTLLILSGLTAGAYFFLKGREGGPSNEFKNRMAKEQSDNQTDRAYQYDMPDKATVLATDGEDKNVLNFESNSVYQVSNSNEARARLDRLIKRTDADFDNPIIAKNPFGTMENSFYFYFHTSFRCMIRYTITVEDETISDHIRYVNNGQENNLTKEHEFLVDGLIPGRTNFIVIELVDSTGNTRETQNYQYTAGAAPSGIPQKITANDGYSKSTISNGMYYVFPSGKSWVAVYDNKGILRGLIPTESYHGRRITASEDCILYQISNNKIAKVSSLGRVTGVIQMKGYGEIRDFSYDGYNEVYWLGKKKKNEYLLATSFQTRKTRVVYRFKKGIFAGSLTAPQNGTIGVVAKNPSGLIYLDAITAAKPKISFVVGKKASWKKVVAKKKIKEDKKFTGWNTKQSMLLAQENETAPAMLVQEGNQYLAVEWQADVAKKTVQKKASATAAEAKSGSQLQKRGNNYVIVCGRAGTYLEMGTDGKAIRRYNYGSGLDSVQKLTLSGMCFYGI